NSTAAASLTPRAACASHSPAQSTALRARWRIWSAHTAFSRQPTRIVLTQQPSLQLIVRQKAERERKCGDHDESDHREKYEKYSSYRPLLQTGRRPGISTLAAAYSKAATFIVSSR
ncbi:MAG TPA: hypothetical protein QGG37_04125, partial [Chloroflexota bacterium]|nr:hypothetical protein [Chloroflexota bacterium]